MHYSGLHDHFELELCNELSFGAAAAAKGKAAAAAATTTPSPKYYPGKLGYDDIDDDDDDDDRRLHNNYDASSSSSSIYTFQRMVLAILKPFILHIMMTTTRQNNDERAWSGCRHMSYILMMKTILLNKISNGVQKWFVARVLLFPVMMIFCHIMMSDDRRVLLIALIFVSIIVQHVRS